MSTILAKLTHVAEGLRRLLSKEKDSVVLRGIVESYLRQIQILEDTTWDMLESRTLDGEGAWLDMISRFLVAPRGELTDANYRIALRARIRILRSSGLPRDLIDVTRLSLPTGFTHTYAEAYPKTSIIEIIGAVDFDIQVLWRNLLRTKPGGTRLFLVWSTEAPEDTFTFAPADVVVDDATRGFSDDAVTDPGGAWADVLGS